MKINKIYKVGGKQGFWHYWSLTRFPKESTWIKPLRSAYADKGIKTRLYSYIKQQDPLTEIEKVFAYIQIFVPLGEENIEFISLKDIGYD